MGATRLFSYIALFSLLLAFGGCSGGNESRVEPFGWVRISNADDTAVAKLEYMFAGSAPADSLALALDGYIDAIRGEEAKGSALGRQAAARAHFWRGRLKLRHGDTHEALSEIDSALALTDSARFPYDARRFRWLTEDLGNKSGGERYAFLSEELDFYKRTGCVLMQSARNMDLGWMMLEAGYPQRAIEYFLAADSILCGTALRTAYVGNRVNIADLKYTQGDTAGALNIFRELQHIPEVRHDDELSTLTDYNLWVIGRDTTALRRAWESLRTDTLRGGLRGVVAAHIAELSLNEGDTTRAAVFAPEVRRFIGEVTQGDHLAFMYKTLGRTAMATGDLRTAASDYAAYTSTSDSLLQEKRRGELIAADISRQIRAVEEASARHRRGVMIRFGAFALISVAALVAGGLFVRRRIKALRKVKEASERAELAMSLRVQEKDGLIGHVEASLRGMVDCGILSAGDISEIQSAIRTDVANSGESSEFARIFTRLNPEFAHRLRSRYPGVKKSSEKLACYIALGLDTRHIARIMNIRPESVRQGRWRLKSQMGLATEDNLEEILRELHR